MDQKKSIRRAAQIREAARWVSDKAIQLQMLEAALFYDRLASTDWTGPLPDDLAAAGALEAGPLGF